MQSSLCTQAQLESPAFRRWAQRLYRTWDSSLVEPTPILHRKFWEWLFIAEALEQHGMLQPGKRGLGFGVGKEPQASLFASLGCDIVATDLPGEDPFASHWRGSAQHGASLEDLNLGGLCDAETFRCHVTYRPVDMNHLPDDLTGFDFTWSACAFEHLGSIVQGQDFILNQMRCLKPGGVAVHTTEFNLSSNRWTLDHDDTVLFRQKDIEELVDLLRQQGHSISVDFERGALPADQHVDVPPYSHPHLKLKVEQFTTTSLGLVITKAHQADGPVDLARSRRRRRQARSWVRRGEATLRQARLQLKLAAKKALAAGGRAPPRR